MKNQPEQSNPPPPNTYNPQTNPRRAATKLKQANHQLDLMKRRFMVLKGQQDYNRYRTLDQQRQIDSHHKKHTSIDKQKQQHRKSLEKVRKEMASANRDLSVKMKSEIREKLESARKNMQQMRHERYTIINNDALKNENKIKNDRDNYQSQNRSKHHNIIEDELKKRQSVSRYKESRIKLTIMDKEIQTSHFMTKQQEKQQEMEKLAQYEQQLLKKNAESLAVSQQMRNKYQEVFSTGSSSSRFLPEIRGKANSARLGKSTPSSDLVVMN